MGAAMAVMRLDYDGHDQSILLCLVPGLDPADPRARQA